MGALCFLAVEGWKESDEDDDLFMLHRKDETKAKLKRTNSTVSETDRERHLLCKHKGLKCSCLPWTCCPCSSGGRGQGRQLPLANHSDLISPH